MSEEMKGSDGADAPDDELIDDQADAAEDFVNGILKAMDLEGEAVADIDEGWINVDVSGPDLGVLIGRHGATIDALQEMTRAAVMHKTSAYTRLMLDIDGYRDRQRVRLEKLAREVADEVLEDGEAIELEPMTSYERKIIHNALADVDGVTTHSEGEGADRFLVVSPE